MVFDKLENLGKHLDGERMKKLAPVLAKLNADTPDGRIEVDGDDLYISVQSYAAQPESECRIEAHDHHIDIQSVLAGCEGVGVFDRETLSPNTPYNEQKDVVFFDPANARAVAKVAVYPGRFVMLLPNEAHNPKQQADPNEPRIRKFVIKVRI